MESYVVRIYRRDPKDPRTLVGVVEQAEAAGGKAFHDAEELIAILVSTGPDQGTRKSKSIRRKKRSVI